MTIYIKKKGFTLIELLVVISIIGLLSSISVVWLNSSRKKARDARRASDAKLIMKAMEMYNDDYKQYPCEELSGNATKGCSMRISGDSTQVQETDGTDRPDITNALNSYIKSFPRDPLTSKGKPWTEYEIYAPLTENSYLMVAEYLPDCIKDNLNNYYLLHFETEATSNLGIGGHKGYTENGCTEIDCTAEGMIIECGPHE